MPSGLNDIDVDETVEKSISVDKTFSVFSLTLDCPPPAGSDTGNIFTQTASVKASVTAKVTAEIELGITAKGTIVPPSLDEVAVFASKT